MTTVTIPARYNGPPDSANGGWFAGHLARVVLHAQDDDGGRVVSVRLSAPPPLERELTVSTADDGAIVVRDKSIDGESEIARARLGGDLGQPPLDGPVPFAQAEALRAAYEGREAHPFPTCFSCGTARVDGLQMAAARVPDGTGEYAAAWRATDISPEVLWAALDCPGGWSAGIAGRPMVLGTMSARIDELPAEGEDCVVMAWPRGSAGRRYESGTAAYGSDGRLLAQAEATWIAVDPATIRPR